jgi:peptidoglycan/xylan/chitin deacetylase (PgdA/CDA1 family)
MRELILLFHGLGEPHSLVDAREMRYWWSPSSFTHLLDQVRDLSANVKTKIHITFDDGNASDAYLALPELSKRGLSAEFFVCVGRVGKKHYLDRSMIKELLAEGMRLGSHGMDHRDWRTLDSKALDVEIGDARSKLEDITQQQVNTVAIPFGSYDRRVLHHLKREIWKVIYTSDRGTTQSTSLMKPRETLDTDMQGEHVLSELLAGAPAHITARRTLSRLYKRLR